MGYLALKWDHEESGTVPLALNCGTVPLALNCGVC